MLSFELDLLRYKRGAVATLGIILFFALSFFGLEQLLSVIEAHSSASLAQLVGFRAIFYLLFTIIGLGCAIFAVPLLYLTYRLVNYKAKYRLEVTNNTEIEFLSPLEFTKVKFSINDTSDIRFVEKNDRYTIDFVMATNGHLKRYVTGENVHRVYVTKSTYNDLKVLFSEEVTEVVAETAITNIDTALS